MRILFTPATSLLTRLPFIGKFAIISVAFFIPTLIGLGVIYNKLHTDVEVIIRKQVRLTYIPALYDVSKNVGKARSLQYRQDTGINSDENLKKQISVVTASIQKLASTVQPVDAPVYEATSQLQGMASKIKGTTTPIDAYNKVILQSNAVADVITTSADLFVEDVPNTYLYGDLLGQQVLPFAENLSMLSAYAVASTGRTYKDNEKEGVWKALDRTRSSYASILRTYERIQRKAASNSNLDAAFKRLKQIEPVLSAVEQKLVTGDANVQGTDEKTWLAHIDSVYAVGSTVSPLLENAFQDAFTSREQVQNSVLALYGVAVILALYMLIAFYMSISMSLRRLILRLNQLQSGDLTKMDDAFRTYDELGSVIKATDEVSDALALMVGESKKSTGVLYYTAQRIATGTAELAQRTEQQGNALTKVKEQMHDLTGTVRQNVENASTASKLASEAADVAQDGGSAMSEVVAAMSSIRESSQRVTDIVRVIQEIASRTDILAINATIEAARAGDAGKGFSVVANEVRKLSVRSGMAAQEIQSLVFTQNQQVNDSTSTIAQAKEKLDDIVKSTKRVNTIMGAIALASKEQDKGITQTNESVLLMQKIAKINHNLVETTAQTADVLQKSASQLRQNMCRFNTDDKDDEQQDDSAGFGLVTTGSVTNTQHGATQSFQAGATQAFQVPVKNNEFEEF